MDAATVKAFSTLFALFLGSGALLAQGSPLEMPLWPSGPPDSNGLKGAETGENCLKNVSEARLTVYLPEPDKATGAAVVVFPGGGYGSVCMESEGHPIAKRLNALGIAGIVVKYRLPNQHHEIPGNDARRAIRTTRAKAAEWNIDPGRIGVWGFSAGGHLASTVTTVFDAGQANAGDEIERQSSRPDFSILFYPVISFEAEVTHAGSRNNLVGHDEGLIERFSNEKRVTEETPPTFLLHCTDDKAVKVENSIRFYQALVRHGVPATCLIYEEGGHGPGAFGKNPSWAGAFEAWLRARGCLD